MVKDYSWIIRGKQRKKIIKVINKPKIPTQIKEETNLSLNNVSDVLREFRKKKIVKVLNPEEKTGRLYKLTLKGMKIREMVEEYGKD
ncbi:MAG TPA: ArsR family transcriptional regulator [Ignavibacteria bacterium]|nr:ArsR family transcriptional regulator [Ignavibacteria bacterium]